MPTGKYGTPITSSLNSCLTKNSAIVKRDYALEPPTIGGSNNVYTLDPDSQSVVLIAKVCGVLFGRFVNTSTYERNYWIGKTFVSGTHSEDQFMAAWEEAWDMKVMREIRLLRSYQGEPLYVTIKLSKSPCHECTKKLIHFMDAYGVSLRLKVLSLYEGDAGAVVSTYALLALISAGASVKHWNVLNTLKGHRRETKLGQRHELAQITRIYKTNLLSLQDHGDREEDDEVAKLRRLYENLSEVYSQKRDRLLDALVTRLQEAKEEQSGDLKRKGPSAEKNAKVRREILDLVDVEQLELRGMTGLDILNAVAYRDAKGKGLDLGVLRSTQFRDAVDNTVLDTVRDKTILLKGALLHKEVDDLLSRMAELRESLEELVS